MNLMATQEKNIYFYATNYDIIGKWSISPSDRIMLGDQSNRICRFCGKKSPEVKFKKIAHAIPELLGNKSIESAYECDTCNKGFGEGIENDLGNWSKPMRTLTRICGKNGVPTLKKGGDKPGWRIEYDLSKLKIRAYEHDPIYEVDEKKKQVTFKLKRDTYTPVAVLKAFMKIGLTLLPEEEISNFSCLIDWVRETDHSKIYLEKCPVIYTFQPGPMPNDLITVFIVRRKQNITGYPYAFLVLGYGNEVFQIPLPSHQHDREMNGQSTTLFPFPIPGHPVPERFGESKHAVLDWMDHQVKKGDIAIIQMGYDSRTPVELPTVNQGRQSE
jgi:hypothetical protein